MNVATKSPTSTPTMLAKSSALTRRSASRPSTGDMSVGHAEWRFPPLHAQPHLLLMTDEQAEPFLVIAGHPNELDTGHLAAHPSDHAQIDPHGPELIEINEQLHVLSSLEWHGRVEETPGN